MNIDFNAWYALESAMQDEKSRRVSRATLKRVARFAHPQRRAVYGLLATSSVAAVLAVASPVLAGRVVDTIIGGRDFDLVVWLALAIAGVAVLEAGFSLAERWQSSRIGEDLILRLRQAVFDHVQRMPIAFFTRTRTGALVSRLNNDVIAAQRAFSETISGVVTNVIALVLTLIVMLTLSWQVTVLAMVLLPIFLLAGSADGQAFGVDAPRGREPRLDDDDPDDRAVLRAGRDVDQAVRPAFHRERRVRVAGTARARHRRADGGGAVAVPRGVDARVLAGVGAGLRAGRVLRVRRADGAGHDRDAGAAADSSVRAVDGVGRMHGWT